MKFKFPIRMDIGDYVTTLGELENSPGEILTRNASGNLGKRTPAQLLSDIGAASSSHTHSAQDINAGTLSVDRLPTIPPNKIENNSITGGKLAVSHFNNMLVNSDWLNGSEPWYTWGTGIIDDAPLGTPSSSGKAAYVERPQGGIDGYGVSSNRFPVSVGDEYYVQAMVRTVSFGLEILVFGYDVDGTQVHSTEIWRDTTGSNWQKVTGSFTVPEGVVSAQLSFKARDMDSPEYADATYGWMCHPLVTLVTPNESDSGDYLPLTGGVISGDLIINGRLGARVGRPADFNSIWGAGSENDTGIAVTDSASSTPNGPSFFGAVLHVGGASNRAFQLAAHTASYDTYRIRSKSDQPNTWKPWRQIALHDTDMGLRFDGDITLGGSTNYRAFAIDRVVNGNNHRALVTVDSLGTPVIGNPSGSYLRFRTGVDGKTLLSPLNTQPLTTFDILQGGASANHGLVVRSAAGASNVAGHIWAGTGSIVFDSRTGNLSGARGMLLRTGGIDRLQIEANGNVRVLSTLILPVK